MLDISVTLAGPGTLEQDRDILTGHPAHLGVDIVVISVGIPVIHPVLHALGYAVMVIELAQELDDGFPRLKVGGEEPPTVIVCDKGAVLNKVVVERLGELLCAQPALQE
ncbi:hypothetical protein ES703_118876 [subsurface metagenome]